MTTINYKINNQTGKELITTNWESAQTLQATTQAEEIKQFGWFSIIAEITNNDNTITICPVDENGVPLDYDEKTDKMVPYIDTTVAP